MFGTASSARWRQDGEFEISLIKAQLKNFFYKSIMNIIPENRLTDAMNQYDNLGFQTKTKFEHPRTLKKCQESLRSNRYLKKKNKSYIFLIF